MPYTMEDFKRDAKEEFLKTLTPEERLKGLYHFAMKSSRYREVKSLKELYFPQPLARYPQPKIVLPSDELLKRLAPEERLKGLPSDELLKRLAPEERLKGLPPEERFKGLTAAEIHAYLEKLLKQSDSDSSREP